MPDADFTLSTERASVLARIALSHVEREYPNKLDHVLQGPADVQEPRVLHPVFYGSFDWHSCVHGYWTLAQALRLRPDVPEAAAIRDLFDRAFTASRVGEEVRYLERAPATFERPYGWAWLLKLQSELILLGAGPWIEVLQPLAEAVTARLLAHLPKATYPSRAGTHANSAFALALIADYADLIGDDALRQALIAKARAWHMDDRDAQAWEPSAEDFLSPTLIEAQCMSRLLEPGEFRAWLRSFLPRIAHRQPAGLFEPAAVSDRADGRIAHLDGLNLSRAWCWRSLAGRLPLSDPARNAAQAAAERHLAAGLPHLQDHYMGEHWLASFALLALTEP